MPKGIVVLWDFRKLGTEKKRPQNVYEVSDSLGSKIEHLSVIYSLGPSWVFGHLTIPPRVALYSDPGFRATFEPHGWPLAGHTWSFRRPRGPRGGLGTGRGAAGVLDTALLTVPGGGGGVGSLLAIRLAKLGRLTPATFPSHARGMVEGDRRGEARRWECNCGLSPTTQEDF